MAYHKPLTLTFQVKVPQVVVCKALAVEDMADCASVLEEKEKASFSPVIYEYFTKGFLGFGAYVDNQMVGYVFIKKPKERPETLSVVRKKWRNLGVATSLRNFAIEQSKKDLVGEFVYSATELWNNASLTSLLNSGYEVTAITGEGTTSQFIQLRRAIK